MLLPLDKVKKFKLSINKHAVFIENDIFFTNRKDAFREAKKRNKFYRAYANKVKKGTK